MKKRSVLLVLALVLPLIFTGCAKEDPYDAANYVGLTAEQIQERYGEFDRCGFWNSTEVCRWGVYVVQPRYVGFLMTHHEEYVRIQFDENGVALGCTQETGGQGG